MTSTQVRVYTSDLYGAHGKALEGIAYEYVENYTGNFEMMIAAKVRLKDRGDLPDTSIKPILNTLLQDINADPALVNALRSLLNRHSGGGGMRPLPKVRLAAVPDPPKRPRWLQVRAKINARFGWSLATNASVYHVLMPEGVCVWERDEHDGDRPRRPSLKVRARCGFRVEQTDGGRKRSRYEIGNEPPEGRPVCRACTRLLAEDAAR